MSVHKQNLAVAFTMFLKLFILATFLFTKYELKNWDGEKLESIIEKTETTTMTNTIKNKIQKDTNLSNCLSDI